MQAWKHRAALTALMIAFLLAPLEASALKTRVVSGLRGGTDTKSKELVALAPDAADGVARRDLLSVLQPAGKFRLETSGNVEGTTFVTWPYFEQYPYVCREDRVTLGYRSVYMAGHDQRVPEGVEAQPMFHIEHLPVPGFVPGPEPATICDASHPNAKATWFAAPNGTDAVRAANMFRMAEDQLKAGRLTPGPCDRTGPDACRKWIVSLDDPSKIVSVEPCTAKARGEVCYVIEFDNGELTDNDELTVVATMSHTDFERITPAAITSIQVDRVVTISV